MCLLALENLLILYCTFFESTPDLQRSSILFRNSIIQVHYEKVVLIPELRCSQHKLCQQMGCIVRKRKT